jgi:hypothetical protein
MDKKDFFFGRAFPGSKAGDSSPEIPEVFLA